ncbi:MAG: long-chain fatty acid--CoA ligase [Planctomycetota bacterium]
MSTETASKAPSYVTPIGRPVTIPQLFREAAKRGDRPALKRRNGKEWETISWKGYYQAATRIANGLIKLGIQPGDRVGIMSNSRVEWCYADMAISGLASVVVPIYQSVRDDEAHYIMADSAARFLFVEDLDQLKKAQLARKRGLPGLEKIVVFDTTDTEKTKKADVSFEIALTLDELIEKGDGGDATAFEERGATSKADDLLTLVYTSGTTGVPKGVMLTHGNALGEVDAIDAAVELRETDVVLSFLPLAHIFARAVHWLSIKGGYTTVYTSISNAAADMQEIRPTCVPSVPRFFEKIFAGVMSKVEEEKPLKKKYVKAALGWAKQADRCAREKKSLGLGLTIKKAIAGPAVSAIRGKMVDKTGGNVRMFMSGGAPLSREVAEFFHTLGFLILEGYGLTETTAGTHVNRVHKYKIGTVGPVVPGVECKIASDGEILSRGTVVMKGYYNKPDATKEVFDEEGWFRTGDIGEIDSEGFLRITDRKKDLLKTAGGKYVAPQKIENSLKTIHGVSQAVLIGDSRPYCTALLTVDPDAMKKMVREQAQREPANAIEDLVKDSVVTKYVEQAIAVANKELPSWETIKYFRILPRDFEIGDELTPTLKVKRKRVAEKYGPLIDEMYASGKAPRD